jgi:hypothetical protein
MMPYLLVMTKDSERAGDKCEEHVVMEGNSEYARKSEKGARA